MGICGCAPFFRAPFCGLEVSGGPWFGKFEVVGGRFLKSAKFLRKKEAKKEGGDVRTLLVGVSLVAPYLLYI